MKKYVFLVPVILLIQLALYQFYSIAKMEFWGLKADFFYYSFLVFFAIASVIFYWHKRSIVATFFIASFLLFTPLKLYYAFVSSKQKDNALYRTIALIGDIDSFKKLHNYYPFSFRDTGVTDTVYSVGFMKYPFRYVKIDSDNYHISFIINGNEQYKYFAKSKQWYKID